MFDVRIMPIEHLQKEPSRRIFEVRVSMTGWFYEVDADLTVVRAVDLNEMELRLQRLDEQGLGMGGWGYPAVAHIDWMKRALICLREEGYAGHADGAPIAQHDNQLENLEVLARVLDAASSALAEKA